MFEDAITALLPLLGGALAYVVGWLISNANALVKKTDTKLDDQAWDLFKKATKDALNEKGVVQVVEVDKSAPSVDSNIAGGTA